MIITTSWDDGHDLDLRVAELLNRHNFLGTFYIAKEFLPERMTDSQLRDLAQRHELVAHTMTHPVLTEIPLESAEREIRDSKQWLQDVIGQPVTSFCYPRGAQNTALQQIAQNAGYSMARGAGGYSFEPMNRFNMATTIHVYPYPMRPLPDYPLWRGLPTRLTPLRRALPHIRDFNLPLMAVRDWQSLATALLDKAAAVDGIWHLWGHSWEIEKFGLWDDLERILEIAATYDATIMTNTQVAYYLWGQQSDD